MALLAIKLGDPPQSTIEIWWKEIKVKSYSSPQNILYRRNGELKELIKEMIFKKKDGSMD